MDTNKKSEKTSYFLHYYTRFLCILNSWLTKFLVFLLVRTQWRCWIRWTFKCRKLSAFYAIISQLAHIRRFTVDWFDSLRGIQEIVSINYLSKMRLRNISPLKYLILMYFGPRNLFRSSILVQEAHVWPHKWHIYRSWKWRFKILLNQPYSYSILIDSTEALTHSHMLVPVKGK